MKKISKTNLLLIAVLIFSFLIRFWRLDSNPTGFFCDEALMGIDALSILKTGKDHHGEFFPLFFKGFNYDNTSPYQVYLTVPFVGLFGLNERAVRLTPIFWSTIELLIFYLVLTHFIPKSIALLGTLLLSLSPWHFHISRLNMGDYYSWTFLTLTSYLFFIKAFKERRMGYFALSALFFGLTTYSYTPSRLITPIVFGLTILLLFFKKYFKVAFLMIFLYVIVLIPFIHFHLTDPHSLQRIKDTMGIDIENQPVQNQLHTARLNHFWKKYFLHYSDTFLFQKGDTDFPGQFIRRHSIAGLGLLYPYQKILIIVGIVWSIIEIIKKKKIELTFVFFLLFLFPIADSLTNDGTPFATRSYLGVLPFHILIAFGLWSIFQILSKLSTSYKYWAKMIFVFSLVIAIFLSALNLLQRFRENPRTTSDFWGWQYGSREIMKYFLSIKDQYDELYMSGEFNSGEIFLKFYDPKSTCQEKCKMGDLWRDPQIYNSSRRQLFSLSPEYLNNSGFKNRFLVEKTLNYPNGKVAFLIGKIVPIGKVDTK